MKKSSNEKIFEPPTSRPDSLLDDILSEMQPSSPSAETSRSQRPIVGSLVDDRDPEQKSRLLIRWDVSGRTVEKWLSPLRGLECTKGDRVLVQHLENSLHPVVTGVIEQGKPHRGDPNEKEAPPATTVTLSTGSSLKVTAENGEPLAEITNTESGPILKVLCVDTVVDLPGRLSLSADDITLNARKGKVEVTAEEDVIVVGKSIYLN